MINGTYKSLESWIWDAACSIHGAQEAPKLKDFIFPLIFTKRLCDVFDDELNRIPLQIARCLHSDTCRACQGTIERSGFPILMFKPPLDQVAGLRIDTGNLLITE